jgi:DNA-binding NarL/FixJ family response regulator
MKKITVILYDDRAFFLQRLRLLLEATDDFEVIGEARASRDLLRAIRGVCSGNGLSGPPIARHSLKKPQNGARGRKTTDTAALTGRQTEVVQWIADGFSNQEIAGVLSLSIKTVEKHRQAAMNKLDIHDLATLTRYAVSSGIVKSNHAPNRRVARVGSRANKYVQLQFP